MDEPTRFEIDGARHYRTDRPGKIYPSVTTILGKTASEHSKKILANWGKKNPGGMEKAAARGTAIHKACEDYIRGFPVDVPDDYLPFWRGISKHLDKYDYFVWSEKPLKPEWDYCIGHDGIARVWSHEYGFVGCPDIVGVRNGVVVLGDFKTSNQPYCRHYGKENPVWKANFTGWSKLNKCGLQLGAYALAVEETLGLKVDCAQIIVSTPEIDQSFIFQGDELSRFQTKWLQRVRRYKELKEIEHQEEIERQANES